MKLSADELETNGYRLTDKLEFAELMPFLSPYLKKGNAAMVVFLAANFLCVAATVFFFMLHLKNHTLAFGPGFGYYLLGLGLAFTLIPLHEYIHAVGYKALGAKKVAYDMDFKKLIFLTVAHKFVAGRQEFTLVALAPFALISLLLLALFPLANINWQIALLGALFMHATFCIGDFGLVSYLLENRHRQLVTYDDFAVKVSYFYERVEA